MDWKSAQKSTRPHARVVSVIGMDLVFDVFSAISLIYLVKFHLLQLSEASFLSTWYK